LRYVEIRWHVRAISRTALAGEIPAQRDRNAGRFAPPRKKQIG